MHKFKSGMNTVLSYLTAFMLIVMTILVIWQVFTRYVLNNPSAFTEELVRIILIWSSFLGAAYAFGTRQHMALVFFKEKTTGIKKKFLYVFIDVVILCFAILVLIRGGYQLASGVMTIKTPILGISRGLIYMIAPFSGTIISIYQLMNIKEDVEMAG